MNKQITYTNTKCSKQQKPLTSKALTSVNRFVNISRCIIVEKKFTYPLHISIEKRIFVHAV